jgi:hypothetical protein
MATVSARGVIRSNLLLYFHKPGSNEKLEVTITVTVSEVTSMPSPPLHPVSVTFTIQTEHGQAEGYYAGRLHWAEGSNQAAVPRPSSKRVKPGWDEIGHGTLLIEDSFDCSHINEGQPGDLRGDKNCGFRGVANL